MALSLNRSVYFLIHCIVIKPPLTTKNVTKMKLAQIVRPEKLHIVSWKTSAYVHTPLVNTKFMNSLDNSQAYML